MATPSTAARPRLGRILRLAFLVLGVLAAAVPAAARPSSPETAACIRDPACHRTFVVAHRAEGFLAPANSRAAVARAVEAGVPVIEIDLRASKDGELFVIHDGTLEGTTTLRGRIESLAAAEVAKARLKNGESLPRFRDIYDISRARAVLSVDFKVPAETMEQVADWIHAHGSFDDMIFFANTGEEMAAAARAKKRYPAMIVMVRLLDTRVTVASTRAVFGRLPEILHTDRVGADQVSDLHALGVKVYMNALPLERYVQPFKYLAVRSLLQTNLDFVLTGEPESLLRRLADGPGRLGPRVGSLPGAR